MRPVDILFPEMKKLKDQGKCPTCGKDIGAFKDALSEREFKISGMCQKCQNDVFEELDPMNEGEPCNCEICRFPKL